MGVMLMGYLINVSYTHDFELAIRARTKCTIHVIDPILLKQQRREGAKLGDNNDDRIVLHPFGIGARDKYVKGVGP